MLHLWNELELPSSGTACAEPYPWRWCGSSKTFSKESCRRGMAWRWQDSSPDTWPSFHVDKRNTKMRTQQQLATVGLSTWDCENLGNVASELIWCDLRSSFKRPSLRLTAFYIQYALMLNISHAHWEKQRIDLSAIFYSTVCISSCFFLLTNTAVKWLAQIYIKWI